MNRIMRVFGSSGNNYRLVCVVLLFIIPGIIQAQSLETSQYRQLKYPSSKAEISVSRWQEAELIGAGYELLQGEFAKAAKHNNRVRKPEDLPQLESTDPQEIKIQIIYEREAEFWLELRRWQDMRYYNIIPDRWIPIAKQLGIDRRRFPVSRDEGLQTQIFNNRQYQITS